MHEIRISLTDENFLKLKDIQKKTLEKTGAKPTFQEVINDLFAKKGKI